MGFFDLFKNKKDKRKTTPTITFEEIKPGDSSYDPWKDQGIATVDNYVIAAFISISRHGSIIGPTNDNYPRYFSYEFNIYDPVSYHKDVVSKGYLVEAEPKVALRKLKVGQLKEILSKYGLSETGKKDDLIIRIIENIDIKTLGLDTYYVPTQKGWEHFKKYEYGFSLKNYGITFQQFDNYQKTHAKHLKPNDIIWQILNEKFNENNINKHFGMAKCELHYKAIFLKSEERYTDALYYFILVLYYELSGCGNNNSVELPEYLYVSPSLMKDIYNLKSYYTDEIIDKVDRYYLPHHYLAKSDFQKLLFDIFENEVVDIHKYIKK